MRERPKSATLTTKRVSSALTSRLRAARSRCSTRFCDRYLPQGACVMHKHTHTKRRGNKTHFMPAAASLAIKSSAVSVSVVPPSRCSSARNEPVMRVTTSTTTTTTRSTVREVLGDDPHFAVIVVIEAEKHHHIRMAQVTAPQTSDTKKTARHKTRRRHRSIWASFSKAEACAGSLSRFIAMRVVPSHRPSKTWPNAPSLSASSSSSSV